MFFSNLSWVFVVCLVWRTSELRTRAQNTLGFFLVSALPGERCSSVLRLASMDESESESSSSSLLGCWPSLHSDLSWMMDFMWTASMAEHPGAAKRQRATPPCTLALCTDERRREQPPRSPTGTEQGQGRGGGAREEAQRAMATEAPSSPASPC